MNKTKLNLRQLKKVKGCNMLDFYYTLSTYGTILVDFVTETLNEREQYFEYKGHYFTTIKKDGEVTKIGYMGNKIDTLLQLHINNKYNRVNNPKYYNI